MFNTFEEQLFVCQSLLKERRQPPTGGLIETLEESLGRGVSTPSSPIVGSKTTPGASEVLFSSGRGKRLVTALGGIDPLRGVSCRSCFYFCGGDHKRACFDRFQTPESFCQCLF